jgi:hypothetical protein
MATPTIPNGEEHFFPIIYEGNGAGQRVGKFVPFTDNGTIANSVIFNDGDSAYLSRTPSGAGNRKTFTFSCWIKLGAGTINSGAEKAIFSARDGSSDNYSILSINGDQSGANQLEFVNRTASGYAGYAFTTRTLEDSSKWYHVMVAVDTTNSTSTDRIKLYVDGDRITTLTYSDPGSNTDMAVNNSVAHALGARPTNNLHWDGYIAEANLVDGTALTPDTFGLTDTSTGRWIPKALTGITYGTNGFRLQFGSSSALGDDTSGNTNDFSVTNLVAGDQTTDSPTQNHATIDINTASNSSMTFAEGNLKVEMNNVYPGNVLGTLGASSGKYYWEVTLGGTGSSANGYATGVGVAEWSKLNSDPGSTTSPFSSYIDSRSLYFHNGTNHSSSTTFASGDVIGIALNLDDSEISYFKNNTIIGSAQPLVDDQTYFPLFKNSTTVADLHYTPNFGQKSWNYTPPTGFVALQQDNLPETAKGVSGFVWIKERTASSNHQVYDSSRGAGELIMPSATNAESTRTDALYKFLKGGYAVGDNSSINGSGDSVVAWNWVANGGTTASNGDGSLSSTVQANTTAGFSIVQWTGDGGQSTVGHGLSGTPKVVIQKRLSSSSDWWFYTTALDGSYDYSKLNSYNSFAAQSSGSAPTSTTFTSHGWSSSDNMVAYVFHEVEGFSKFGGYTGNGNADGPFVYTGFKVRWLMHKANNGAGWYIYDTVRDENNPLLFPLFPNTTGTESTNVYGIDFLSNGFKLRQPTGYGANYSGVDVFYMAFAEHPFVGDGTNPVTAR